MKRKILITVGVLAGILVMGFGILYLAIMRPAFKEQERVRNMPINEVDLSKVMDGSYRGDFSYANFTYEAEVSVKNHEIENIKILKNREDEYAKRAEGVVQKVRKSQSLDVDTVTGATTTSKALLKAMENALNKGVL
ncbi:MAG TPA: FMN-binding protein [Actinobacteria bacterium]|nr:FMN-binding protein [Actinomycetota bacterium]